MQDLKLRSSSERFRLRPMKTSRFLRLSPAFQASPIPSALEPKLSSMCTPWKKCLQHTHLMWRNCYASLIVCIWTLYRAVEVSLIKQNAT